MFPQPRFCASAEQREVISHADGHALVSAVAGSGKSQTLVERVASLVEGGCAYDRILILMFNVGAADEFIHRLARRMPHLPNPTIQTFHAYGQVLCRQLERSGLLASARLLDETQAQPLGREVLEYVNARRESAHRIEVSNDTVAALLSAMDTLKGALYDGECIPETIKGSISALHLAAYPVFERFRLLRQARLFGDLIADPVRAAQSDARLRRAIGKRFTHIIVDEFQDINEAQMALVRLLAGDGAQVMVVGDEDQTIYTWRGARPEYMVTRFEQEFPGTRRYALTRTFRYGHTLSLLANEGISHNHARAAKLCVSDPSCPATQIAVRMHPVGDTSGAIVAEEVQRWVGLGRRYSEIAILVRQFSSAVPIEIALREKGIPFHLVGAPHFVQWPEVQSLHLPLILAASKGMLPTHWSSTQRSAFWKSALSVPSLYLRRFELAAITDQLARHAKVTPDIILEGLRSGCSSGSHTLSGVRAQWMAMIEWAYSQHPDANAEDLLREVIRITDLAGWVAKSGGSYEYREARLRMVRSVVSYARGHTSRSLHRAFCDIDRSSQDANNATAGVLITSIHRAKGLEWPAVILPELTEGVFPGSEANIEDERRLFYVAATRAREELVMVCPLDRDLVAWSRSETPGVPVGGARTASRFLYEANLSSSQRIGAALNARASITPPPAAESVVGRYLDSAKASLPCPGG